MTYKRKEIIGNATLYLGDCMDVIPTLDKVDAVVTDPPYGVDYNPKRHKKYNGQENQFEKIKNDNKEINLGFIFELKCPKIIWGAENLYKQLPHRGRWACWYKRSFANKPNTMTSGDFELAWMDKESGFYKFIHCVHGGVINADSTVGNNEKRCHPTQKPIHVMEQSINFITKENEIILDPFMGSGTTLVACVKMGKSGIGIEIDEDYFDIACKRIEDAQRQGDMFL